MSKQWISAFVIMFVAMLMVLPGFAGEYLWPLKITPRLSSQFGDYRAGHWHAGIDITTRGKPGYKVYAVADGYVFRVKTSYWGYGKALYLKLNDGNYAVYGHLERFSPEMDNYIFMRQMKSRSFYQDIFFRPGEFPVKRGDYIALSGQSGAGAPHLHLEIRDAQNLPINPLKGIYSIPDKSPPRVEYLVVGRFKNPGLLNYHDFEFLNLDGETPGYTVTDTVALYDRAVFSISTFDPNLGYNYGIYGASLMLDGAEIFAFSNDRLDYDSGNQIDFVRDNSLKRLVDRTFGERLDNDKNVFYRLYMQPYDRQSFYGDYSFPAGIISADSLDDSVHNLLISLYDVSGNKTDIQVFLKKAAMPEPHIDEMLDFGDTLAIRSSELSQKRKLQIQKRESPVTAFKDILSSFNTFAGTTMLANDDNKNSEFRLRTITDSQEFSPWVTFKPDVAIESMKVYADYLDIVISGDDPVMANDILLDDYYSLPLIGGYRRLLVPTPVNNGYFQVALRNCPESGDFYVLDSGGRVYSPDSSIFLDITEQQLYGKSVISITAPGTEGEELIFKINPEDLLFQTNTIIHVYNDKLGILPEKISLYYYSPDKNKWFYIGRQSGGLIEGETAGGGKFGILYDSIPPAISRLTPRNGRAISDKTPYLNCYIDDNLSGIKRENQLEMTIDGIWVPADYDIDSKAFGYQVKNPLKGGSHLLRVTASDNQGNESTAVSRFKIR